MEQVVLLSLAGLWLIVILLLFIYMIYSMVDFIKDGDWGYVVEDLNGVNVSPYHYEINVLPKSFQTFSLTFND